MGTSCLSALGGAIVCICLAGWCLASNVTTKPSPPQADTPTAAERAAEAELDEARVQTIMSEYGKTRSEAESILRLEKRAAREAQENTEWVTSEPAWDEPTEYVYFREGDRGVGRVYHRFECSLLKGVQKSHRYDSKTAHRRGKPCTTCRPPR